MASKRSRSGARKNVTPQAAVTPRDRSAGAPWLIAVALALLSIAVFAQVRTFEFVDFDDGLYVVDNPNVRTGLTAENVAWAFTTGRAANWHPLTWISHQVDASLFGMNAGMHHLTNVAWHVLNTLLLFGLLRAMTGALWRSAFVAALFAVHPAHVESVAWVSERKDVLSTCFWLLTTWAWVRWVRRPSAGRLAISLVAFALGLMSKPMLVTLPFTLLLLDVWPLARTSVPLSRRVIEKLPFFALALASSVVTFIVQQRGGAVAGVDVLPLAARAANAAVAYATYFQHLVWPFDLAAYYPHTKSVPAGAMAVALGLLAALSALAWSLRRSQPYVIVGWLWFLGTMVPVIGLVQIGTQALADRYTYVPYIGLFVAIVWGVRAIADRAGASARVPQAAGVAVVALLAVLAHTQAATWRTSEALWSHAVAVTEGNALAHNKLGAIHGNSGREAEAIVQFTEALRLRPDASEAKHILPNLGRALMSQGRVTEAIPYLERARPLNPGRADIHHQLALAYATAGRQEEAIASWREAVRLDPKMENAWFLLGVTFAAAGRIDDARQAFTEVLRINPGRKDAQQALAQLR